MAQIRSSNYTRRRPKEAGGLLPSFLFGKKSEKQKAWKKHVETRSPFMNNLKNMLKKRDKTCGDKDSKKTNRVITRLKKSMKLSEVGKFVKDLNELSAIIKKWDDRVLSYAVDLGKKCGMFEVIPQNSDIIVFISERISYEHKNDPDNFTWDVVPVLKPGMGVDEKTGVERDRYGRFTRRVGKDLTRTDRDDIRRAMNRRIIQTRANKRADEIQFGDRSSGKQKLTSWDRDWFDKLTNKYDIDNIPEEKRDALSRTYRRKNTSDKRNDPRYYPDGKGYGKFDRRRLVDPLRRESGIRRRVRWSPPTTGPTAPNTVDAARARARAMAAARASAAADRITRRTRDSGVAVSPGVRRRDPVDEARERARAMAAARASAAADRITRRTRDSGTESSTPVPGSPFMPPQAEPVPTQTESRSWWDRLWGTGSTPAEETPAPVQSRNASTDTGPDYQAELVQADIGTQAEPITRDTQVGTEVEMRDTQVGTEVEMTDAQNQAIPNSVDISVGTDITGELPNGKEQSFAQTQAHKLAGMFEATQAIDRRKERAAAQTAANTASAAEAQEAIDDALRRQKNRERTEERLRQESLQRESRANQAEAQRVQTSERRGRALRRASRLGPPPSPVRAISDQTTPQSPVETQGLRRVVQDIRASTGQYSDSDEDFDSQNLSSVSSGVEDDVPLPKFRSPPLNPSERVPIPPNPLETALGESHPEATSGVEALGQDDIETRLAHERPDLFTQTQPERPSLYRRRPPTRTQQQKRQEEINRGERPEDADSVV